jgi:hypothetical protein
MAPTKDLMPPNTVYQLKITLAEIDPPVWRRIRLRATASFDRLHRAIQVVMGWENYHLHEFRIQGREIGMPDPEAPRTEDDRKVKLRNLHLQERDQFVYVYDFGDSWHHDILVERILKAEKNQRYPVCLDGLRSAPPEDCGGIGGYERYLSVLSDPDHEDHEELLQWRGPFDPEAFDPKIVDRELRSR